MTSIRFRSHGSAASTRRKRLLGTALLTAMLTVAAEGRAVVLSLEPAVFTANPGDSVTLDLTVSGLGNGAAPSLGGFEVNVTYDSTSLSFTRYTLGSSLGDVNLFEALDSTTTAAGLIDLTEVSLLLPADLDALQADSFVLATLDFTVMAGLAPGQSTAVQISPVSLVDGSSSSNPLSVSAGNGATLSRQASPPIGGVPEPATLALVLAGLGMIGNRPGKGAIRARQTTEC